MQLPELVFKGRSLTYDALDSLDLRLMRLVEVFGIVVFGNWKINGYYQSGKFILIKRYAYLSGS